METRLLYISFNQCLRFLVLKTQKLRFGDVRFKFRGCILLGSKVYLIVKLFWNGSSCGAILQISNRTKWKIAIAVVNKKCSFLTEMTSSSYFFIIWTWHDSWNRFDISILVRSARWKKTIFVQKFFTGKTEELFCMDE